MKSKRKQIKKLKRKIIWRDNKIADLNRQLEYMSQHLEARKEHYEKEIARLNMVVYTLQLDHIKIDKDIKRYLGENGAGISEEFEDETA